MSLIISDQMFWTDKAEQKLTSLAVKLNSCIGCAWCPSPAIHLLIITCKNMNNLLRIATPFNECMQQLDGRTQRKWLPLHLPLTWKKYKSVMINPLSNENPSYCQSGTPWQRVLLSYYITDSWNKVQFIPLNSNCHMTVNKSLAEPASLQ